MEKLDFIQHTFPELVAKLKWDDKGQWGVMNAQQMVEHMAQSIRIANGREPHQLHTPAEMVDKMQAFAMSDKPFKPNTKNVLMGDEPPALTLPDMQAAIDSYKAEVAAFVAYFQQDLNKKVTNPFFGELDFNQWVHLFDKHCKHHLVQFQLIPSVV